LPSDPSLIELEKQGVCKNVAEECIEGPATRAINGLTLTRECWKKLLTYECGGKSSANNCVALEQKGCWQVGSKCIKQIGSIPIEYEQTFECPGGNYQIGTGLVADSNGLTVKIGTDPLVGETFNGEAFAEAVGKFNLVKEMKKGLMPDPNDPEGVRVFNGAAKSCDIDFGSGIKNCCRLKGIFLNLIGPSCPGDVKEVLAPAVVRDHRCQLIEEKYCIKKTVWGCRKWRTTYCCFNSKLGRVFQQIAHIQLGIPWGSGEAPNCGSLSPRDFEKLNFDAPEAQSLLAEIINDAQANIDTNFQLAQQKLAARANLTERIKEMQTNLSTHMTKKFPGRPEGIQR
jgi:conjugal transfer mating pair stabilization protein TraN